MAQTASRTINSLKKIVGMTFVPMDSVHQTSSSVQYCLQLSDDPSADSKEDGVAVVNSAVNERM